MTELRPFIERLFNNEEILEHIFHTKLSLVAIGNLHYILFFKAKSLQIEKLLLAYFGDEIVSHPIIANWGHTPVPASGIVPVPPFPYLSTEFQKIIDDFHCDIEMFNIMSAVTAYFDY